MFQMRTVLSPDADATWWEEDEAGVGEKSMDSIEFVWFVNMLRTRLFGTSHTWDIEKM
jgi:hypothetical protein